MSSLQDLFTRTPYETSLYKISSFPWTSLISSHELSTRSLHKISTKDFYEKSLLQDLLPRSLHKTSIRQDPNERSLYKISWYLWASRQDLYERSLSLFKSSLQDLVTRPLWEIPIQDLLISLDLLDLFIGALYKPDMKDLFARFPDIPGPPRSLHKNSLQNLVTGPLWEISLQELFTGPPYETSLYKISWYPWTSQVSS